MRHTKKMRRWMRFEFVFWWAVIIAALSVWWFVVIAFLRHNFG